MKPISPIKFTRQSMNNSNSELGKESPTQLKANPSITKRLTSQTSDVEIKVNSPVPKYNQSMLKNSASYSNQTSKIEMKGKNPISQQILTSFPNQNSKNIDYVLVYEKIKDKEAEDEESQRRTLARKAFFETLKLEKIDYYEIEHEHDDKTISFVLLNCSMERLPEEAELTRLEMVLKNVSALNNNVFFKK